MLQGLLLSMSPGNSTEFAKVRTVCMPAVLIGFYDDSSGVCLHVVFCRCRDPSNSAYRTDNPVWPAAFEFVNPIDSATRRIERTAINLAPNPATRYNGKVRLDRTV